MEKVIWSELALQDLKDIYDFIRLDSKVYADKTLDAFFDRVEILPAQPRIGRVVPERNDDNIREVLLGNYRIMYFIGQLPTVIVYRVIHFSRLFND
ncbi:MAG TPA: type II toxin-antitoxin system RelE/ParE family toxin [Flavipsychrobacter sp.]|nr:type II toxin-antitoxin system RelE/ParE family toxin [Flavipsychrobacter sp.]